MQKNTEPLAPDFEQNYQTLIHNNDKITSETRNRFGDTAAKKYLISELAAKKLKLLSGDQGLRIVTDEEYTLNETILSAVTFRTKQPIYPTSTNHDELIDSVSADLNQKQKTAVKQAIRNRILIINGPPGTGKSRIIATIRKLIDHIEGADLCIVAAYSARIATKTGLKSSMPGKTLHSITGTMPGSKIFRPNTMDQNLKALFVDEAYSVDTDMLARILTTTNWNTRVILVGDPHQNMPIGGGRTLHDITDLDIVPTITLTDSYRLGKTSNHETSHLEQQFDRINHGLIPHSGPGLRIHTTDGNEKRDSVTKADAAVRLLRNSMREDKSCIILTPTQYGDCGHRQINQMITRCETPETGHQIITTAPHPKGDWKNGEIGTIVEHDDHRMRILFEDDREVITGRRRPEIAFGYAISGHRGQGLEYQRAIVILDKIGNRILNRQYLAAAITRAPECVVLTSPGLLRIAVSKNELHCRTSIIGK